MKNTSLIVSIISLVAAITFGVLYLTGVEIKKNDVAKEGEKTEITATEGDIVYIDLDKILMEYDMANDLRAAVETKVQNIEAEVQRRGKKLEKDINNWQEKLNKGLMTRSVAEAQQVKLQKQQEEFAQYAAQKEQEIQEEQMVMMNQLGDAIKTYLDKYNEEMQYAMIITNNGGAPVITADPGLNITDDVLAGLNEEYVSSKKANSEE